MYLTQNGAATPIATFHSVKKRNTRRCSGRAQTSRQSVRKGTPTPWPWGAGWCCAFIAIHAPMPATAASP